MCVKSVYSECFETDGYESNTYCVIEYDNSEMSNKNNKLTNAMSGMSPMSISVPISYMSQYKAECQFTNLNQLITGYYSLYLQSNETGLQTNKYHIAIFNIPNVINVYTHKFIDNTEPKLVTINGIHFIQSMSLECHFLQVFLFYFFCFNLKKKTYFCFVFFFDFFNCFLKQIKL